MKKILSIALVVVLLAGIAVSGTMAYLTDTDSAVNVMTLGNVEIDQIELERKEQSDDNVTSANLKEFSQAKPLYPAVGTLAWAEDYQEWATGGSNQLFTADLKNVQDKFVFVENTGKSDAYVRTFVAFEQGSMTEDEFEAAVGQNINGGFWTWENVAYGVKIKDADGTEGTYAIKVATYKGNADGTVHKDGILPAGETTRPSLLQVLLYSTVTNEDVDAIDGNGNDTYDILVYSEAVQTEGFADAKTALNTAFYVPSENAHPWVDGIQMPVVVSSPDDMRQAMKTPGAKLVLSSDVTIDDDKGTGYALYAKYDCTIDLNGHDLVVDMDGEEFYGVVYALKGAKVDIVGDGNVEINGGVGPFIWCTSGTDGTDGTEVNIYGGNWIQNSSDFNEATDSFCEGIYANRSGVINVYGGFFNWGTVPKYTVNESREGVINIYGGTFVNFDPRVSHDTDGSYVAEGYTVVSETQTNGDIWHTVVPE